MWVEILCGLIIYRLVKRFLYEDDLLEVDTSDSSALFAVAKRLEKVYGGKAYVGLKIPDAETCKPVGIDMVVVSDSEATVVSVKNVSGLVTAKADGSWMLESGSIPDPLEALRGQLSVLHSYVEQRGLSLDPSFFACKLVLPNPKSCALHCPPEVITHDQLSRLKAAPKSFFSGWIRRTSHDSPLHNLNFILATAPIWDRLELKSNTFVLGEFLEFTGNQQDVDALRLIKRSKVARLLIQKTSMLGLAHSRLRVFYSPRDYRTEGASTSEWKEVEVRSSTEVVFHLANSSKQRKFKLSSIVSMQLSA